jgi:hypothetical protein
VLTEENAVVAPLGDVPLEKKRRMEREAVPVEQPTVACACKEAPVGTLMSIGAPVATFVHVPLRVPEMT